MTSITSTPTTEPSPPASPIRTRMYTLGSGTVTSTFPTPTTVTRTDRDRGSRANRRAHDAGWRKRGDPASSARHPRPARLGTTDTVRPVGDPPAPPGQAPTPRRAILTAASAAGPRRAP